MAIEIVRYYRKGRYLLAETRDNAEPVVLARLIGPMKRATVVSILKRKEKKKNPQKEKEKPLVFSEETT